MREPLEQCGRGLDDDERSVTHMKELPRDFRVGKDRVAEFSTLEVLCSI